MNEKKARQIKNKIHLLTFFITQCEEEEPLEEDEEKWHPEFEEAIKQILFVNEHGYLNEDKLHELNELFQKWSKRFEELGLDQKPVTHWKNGEDALEDEIYELLTDYIND